MDKIKEIGENISFTKEKNKKNTSTTQKKSNKKKIKEIKEVKNKKNDVSFYIINYNEGGFVLVSADKRIQPIIGFSEKDTFTASFDSIPEGLQFWIEDTKKQITEIQYSETKQTKKAEKAWGNIQMFFNEQNLSYKLNDNDDPLDCEDRTVTVTKGPLLSTKWSQQGTFNDALPFITCNNNPYQVLAGCVPVAMAQIMKYHEYPTSYKLV